MRRAVASALPALLAVTSVGFYGWLRSRLSTEESKPTRATVMKRISAEKLGAGLGPLRGDRDSVRAAAWLRYASYADGQRRPPSQAQATLRFLAHDERGKRWPLLFHFNEEDSYLYVPQGYTYAPKKLTVEVVCLGRVLGSWEMPPLAKPERKISPSQFRDPSFDYPGFKFAVDYSLNPGMGQAVIQLACKGLDGSDARTSLNTHLESQTFGALDLFSPIVCNIPEVFAQQIDAVSIVIERRVEVEHEVSVMLRNPRLVQGVLLFDNLRPFEVAPKVTFEIRPFVGPHDVGMMPDLVTRRDDQHFWGIKAATRRGHEIPPFPLRLAGTPNGDEPVKFTLVESSFKGKGTYIIPIKLDQTWYSANARAEDFPDLRRAMIFGRSVPAPLPR